MTTKPYAYFWPGFLRAQGQTLTLKLGDVPAGRYYIRILELDKLQVQGVAVTEGQGRNDLLYEFRVEVQVDEAKRSRFASVESRPAKVSRGGALGEVSFTSLKLAFDGLPQKHSIVVFQDLDDFFCTRTPTFGTRTTEEQLKESAARMLELGVELVDNGGRSLFLSKAPCWIPKPQGKVVVFTSFEGLPITFSGVEPQPGLRLTAPNASGVQILGFDMPTQPKVYALRQESPVQRLDSFLRAEADAELEALQKAALLGITLKISASLRCDSKDDALRILPAEELELCLAYSVEAQSWTGTLTARDEPEQQTALQAVAFEAYNVIKARFKTHTGRPGRLLLALNKNWATGFYGLDSGPLRHGLGGNFQIGNLAGVYSQFLQDGYIPFETIATSDQGDFQRLIIEKSADTPPRVDLHSRKNRVVVPPPEQVTVYLEVSCDPGKPPGALSFHLEGIRDDRHVRMSLADELKRTGSSLQDLGCKDGTQRYRFALPRNEEAIYHLCVEDARFPGIRVQGNRLVVVDETSLLWIVHFTLDTQRLERARAWAPRLWFSGYDPRQDSECSYEHFYPRSYWNVLAHSKIRTSYLRKQLWADGRLKLPHHATIPMRDARAAFDNVKFGQEPHARAPVVVYANPGAWGKKGFAQYFMLFTQSASSGFRGGTDWNASLARHVGTELVSHHEGDVEVVSFEDPSHATSLATFGAHYHAAARPMQDIVCLGDTSCHEPLVTVACNGHGTFPAPTHCSANAMRHRESNLETDILYSFDLAGGQYTELRAQCVSRKAAGYIIELIDEDSPWLQYSGRWGASDSKSPQGPWHRDTMNPVNSAYAKAELEGVKKPCFWADAQGKHRHMRNYAGRMPDTSLLARRVEDAIEVLYYVGGREGTAELQLYGGQWSWTGVDAAEKPIEEQVPLVCGGRVMVPLTGPGFSSNGWHRVVIPDSWGWNLHWTSGTGNRTSPPSTTPIKQREEFALELRMQRPYSKKPAIDSSLYYYFVEGESSSAARVATVLERARTLPRFSDHGALTRQDMKVD